MSKTQKDIDRSAGISFGVAVFLLAVLVRGLYLYDSSDSPTFFAPIVDSLTYDQMARGLLDGRGITREFFWQPMFYPLFLSMVYWLSHSSVIWVKFIQLILGGVTCVLVYRLGQKLFGRPAGMLAGVITAVYVPLVFFEGELLAVGWAAFWSVTLVLVLIKAGEKPSVWSCFVLGLLGALSIITRPVFLPFFAAGCIWLLVVWIRGRIEAKKLVVSVATIAAGFLVVAGPVAISSYQVMGKVMILPYSGSVNLYIGNNPNYKETITIRPGLGWRELVELPGKQGIKDDSGKQRFFADKTVDYIVNEPASFLKGLVYKTAQFFSSREMPRNVDIYLFRRWSAVLRAGVWKAGRFGFPFGVLLPLAVVGAVYRRRKVPWPIWLLAIFYPASVILVFVTSRYRTPIIPVTSVLAAAGCGAVWKILQGRQWPKLAVAGVIVLGIGLVSTAAGPFYAEQIDYEPELYYWLADSLEQQGRADQAIRAYCKAISSRADYVEAHRSLGLLLVEQKRLQEAVAHYNTALAVVGEDAGLHEGLGMALSRQGKIKDAIEHYHKAIQIDPEKAGAYSNLGTAFLALNRLDEALKNYSRAIELNPNDSVTHNNIANIFAIQGRLHKAVEHLEISLRIKPGDPETLNNLANALASLGKFQQAAEKYKDALRVAPDDADIYFNLGICLQQQGRIDEAVAAFRKALAIEPGHKEARQGLEKLGQ